MAGESYLEIVKNLAGQIEEASKIEPDRMPVGVITKIVVTGMGGSSITGAILRSYMHKSAIPVFISREYSLPEHVDRNTLVFAISYSGNTEETLNSIRTAFRKGAQMVAITSGGKLLTKFREHKMPLIQIPSGLQPRAALAYQLIPMLRLLGKMKLISDPSREIARTADALRKASYDSRAKSLAGKLLGKIPIIYASERLASVAYRWKTQFNENAKIHAFSHTFSELNHNELLGYSNLHANYYAILLEDETDHPRIRTRIRLTRELISKQDVPSTQILIKGDNLLTRLFSAIHIGDLASVYLALLTNTDPEPVIMIENFKKRLGKSTYV